MSFCRLCDLCHHADCWVMIMTSSELSRISFSRMISSLVRPASTVMTRLPAAFRACTIGSMGATPTPPPAQTTVPKLSMCVACPNALVRQYPRIGARNRKGSHHKRRIANPCGIVPVILPKDRNFRDAYPQRKHGRLQCCICY